MIKLNNIDNTKFRKIMETLTRIGVTKKEQRNVLFQTTYLLKINGKCFLSHYKEILDVPLSDKDILRLNCIANLLERWELCNIDPEFKENIEKQGALETVFILGKERKINDNWKIFTVVTVEKLQEFLAKKRLEST